MQMVKVSVSHHDEIDQRHQFEAETGSSLPFDNSVPVCPVRVDDHRVIWELNQKGGVPNPGDANFSGFGWMRDRLSTGAVAFLKNLRQQAMAQEVVVPTRPPLLGQNASIILLSWRGVGF
jgi:hypothetical protein